MRPDARSLNLSNSVAITVYEALRQLRFPHLQDSGKMKDGFLSHSIQSKEDLL